MPTILFSIEDGEARGSARSVPDIDIKAALDRCRDLLIRYGGHPQAAGMSLRTQDLDAFRDAFLRAVVETPGSAGVPENYDLPLPEDQGTGLGKPLKIINHPVREDIPIYIASLGPKNVEMTAEIADGWIPVFFHPEKAADVWGDDLAAGAANRAADLPPMEVVAGGSLAITDDEHTAQKIRDGGRFMTALYVGGMGAKGKNFYNNIFRKYGYEDAAEKIQDLYLEGKKDEAMDLVPQDFLDATAMVGDEGYVRDRVQAYKEAGVTRLSVQPTGPDPLALIEKVKGWIS